MKHLLRLLCLLLLIGCAKETGTEKIDLEKWKVEVAATEKAFSDMAQEKGLVEAFTYFAAEDGAIRRNGEIIKGKEAIRAWYENDVTPGETLVWKPTFVDVSNSGDLAYTYGNFTYTYYDSLGNEEQNEGLFHTVWKRQEDGSWS